MKIIRLNLRGRNPLQKVAFARLVADGLTDNPAFPTPAVTPEQLRDAATALEAKEAKVSEVNLIQQGRTLERNTAEAALDELLEDAAEDVEDTAEGNKVAIISANFQVRQPPAPVGPLPAPTGVYVTAGDEDGELDAVCDPVAGRDFFEWQVKEEGTDAWVTKETDKRSRASFSGLTSGKRYRVRVRAKGTAGYSPWSDETSARTAP